MKYVYNLAAENGPPAEAPEVRLLWTDPPFGTGKRMTGASGSYVDGADTGYVLAGLLAWLPLVAPDGTVAVCCDYRLASKAVSAIEAAGWVYRGEVIWQFGLGRPRSSWWPVRHNNILTFTRCENVGLFDAAAVPRVERLAKVRGYPDTKPAGSVWDFTMSNTHPDRVGYPNQKPIEIITPFVLAHTLLDDYVADPFCGSGSTGAAAAAAGRGYVLNDVSAEAVAVAVERLAK